MEKEVVTREEFNNLKEKVAQLEQLDKSKSKKFLEALSDRITLE